MHLKIMWYYVGKITNAFSSFEKNRFDLYIWENRAGLTRLCSEFAHPFNPAVALIGSFLIFSNICFCFFDIARSHIMMVSYIFSQINLKPLSGSLKPTFLMVWDSSPRRRSMRIWGRKLWPHSHLVVWTRNTWSVLPYKSRSGGRLELRKNGEIFDFRNKKKYL